MKFSHKVLAVATVALAAVSLAACGGSKSGSGSSKGDTVTFIPKLTGNSYFTAGNNGAQKMGKKEGFKVKYDGDSTASVSNQVRVINNAVQQGQSAISISAVDPTGLDSALKAAQKKGVAVTTWDSDVSPDARSLMVAQGTPEQLGKMLVQMGVDGLKARGKDPAKDAIKYAWHYSQATVADQNSWQHWGEDYIKKNYPNWINVNKSNYYSNQDAQKAIDVGAAILSAHKDIDLIICNDSTALPGTLQAAQNAKLTEKDITITGFANPNSIKQYAKKDILYNWGLWNVEDQGAMAVYLAHYIAQGHKVKVGDKIKIPGIGTVKVQNNSVLDPKAKDYKDHGVVVLPKRTVFTKENMDDYDF
ncbi:substrate-binding domain-containing protein [Lacticaseibacillus suibinensis]|jgi:AI-2 transport system substrate-binding protein|uniref:substrate-binding domain-containing protein n=1 Tax=Lacticaseibacillus suibinensis TaxID=2486011 RepID=UPI001942EC42|nr:substrate-binding domain-containing protein [Lacticaseibacillus suibinensis]